MKEWQKVVLALLVLLGGMFLMGWDLRDRPQEPKPPQLEETVFV